MINLEELIRKSADETKVASTLPQSSDDEVEKFAEDLQVYAEEGASLSKLAELAVNKELLKTAATTLRTINRERKEAFEKLARSDEAEKLIKKMLNTQEFTPEEVLDKLSEFKQMSLQDLVLANKAIDMVKGGTFKIGSLSDQPAPGGEIDNLTYYLLYGEQN
jgi:hypothetical protein